MAPSPTSFTISHDCQASRSSIQEIHLPFAPFNCGKWELFAESTSSYTITCGVRNSQSYVRNPHTLPILSAEGHFPVEQSGSRRFSITLSSYGPRVCRMQLVITPGQEDLGGSMASLASMASSLAAHLARRYPNNVRFVFPKYKEELWANVDALKAASPCFIDLLGGGSSEGRLVASPTVHAKSTADFDSKDVAYDSDDETDQDILRPSTSAEMEGAEAGTSATAGASPNCDALFHEVIIEDAAYTTYKALLVWLQTNHIDFAPLRSSFSGASPRSARALKLLAPRPDGLLLPISASSKSVYRLAHLLSLPKLSALVLTSLSSQLTPNNVLTELLDPVAGVYDKVQDLELAHAVRNWASVKGSSAMVQAEAQAASGELGHPAAMLLRLARRLG